MNKIKTLLILTSVILMSATLASFAGCSGSECVATGDCETGFVCDVANEQCVARSGECSINADCTGEGELCLTDSASGEPVCRVPADCSEVDSVSAYCRAREGLSGDEKFTCVNAVCEREYDMTCAQDAECDASAGEFCLPDDDVSSIKHCRAPSSCLEAPDVGAYCRIVLGMDDPGDYTCDASSNPGQPKCLFGTPANHYHVLIDDVTTTDCDLTVDENGFDSGSDITFVELQSKEGTSLGWGKTVYYQQGQGGNEFTNQSVLSGTAPRLLMPGDVDARAEEVASRCPVGDGASRFTQNSVLTLGCGGSVIVSFPKDDTSHPIYNGQKVAVGEYASVCNRGEGGNLNGTDQYEVYLCPATASVPDAQECRTEGVKISLTSDGGLKVSEVQGGRDAP